MRCQRHATWSSLLQARGGPRGGTGWYFLGAGKTAAEGRGARHGKRCHRCACVRPGRASTGLPGWHEDVDDQSGRRDETKARLQEIDAAGPPKTAQQVSNSLPSLPPSPAECRLIPLAARLPWRLHLDGPCARKQGPSRLHHNINKIKHPQGLVDPAALHRSAKGQGLRSWNLELSRQSLMSIPAMEITSNAEFGSFDPSVIFLFECHQLDRTSLLIVPA